MNLEEYAAKHHVLLPAGVPIPNGMVCKTPEEASAAVAKIGPSVVKAQVPAGKRGKSGGIKMADTADEGAAAACYGSSVPARAGAGVTTWDDVKHRWTNSDMVELAADTGRGVVMLRPNMMRYEQDPVILHEFLHAYHAKLMPHGFENMGINNFYSQAQKKNLFAKDEYVLKNSREFFAVTASIFLVGKDSVHEPHDRAKLKELMPDYYNYLVGVFGFDPDAPGVTPVASAD